MKRRIKRKTGIRMSPSRFMAQMDLCATRKENGFCENCQLKIRFQEHDGHMAEGMLDMTILNSIKLVGGIPHNLDFVEWVEIIPPYSQGHCTYGLHGESKRKPKDPQQNPTK